MGIVARFRDPTLSAFLLADAEVVSVVLQLGRAGAAAPALTISALSYSL